MFKVFHARVQLPYTRFSLRVIRGSTFVGLAVIALNGGEAFCDIAG